MCARANASAHTKAMKLHFNVFSLLELSVRTKHKNHSYFSHIASVCRRWQWHRAHPEYKTIIFKPSVCFRSDRWCTNAAWRHTLKLLHRTVNWTLKHNLAAMTFLCATKVAVCCVLIAMCILFGCRRSRRREEHSAVNLYLRLPRNKIMKLYVCTQATAVDFVRLLRQNCRQ